MHAQAMRDARGVAMRRVMRPVMRRVMRRVLGGPVRGPVLAQMGDQDALFPGSLAGQEAAFYPNACLTVQVLGDQGHSVNLHRERRDGWAKIHDWLDSTL